MKKKYLFKVIPLILVFSSLFFSCSTSKVFQTECFSLASSGYVEITIWDGKTGAKYSQEQARKDAIYAILFSGVSGSKGCSSQPPILNTEDAESKFEKISKDFFSKTGQWNRFTSSAKVSNSVPASIGENKWKVYQVSISKNELRKYLEEQKIIKSLTNGF
ncbi:MAG: hypothetical protein P8O83_06210 [Flavobacteriaceae bacterium]|jgi:hypothetical protein|nr:hypothetical protein [Flavobacteriaceae bacterium]